ncbi:DUF4136 domain-containing protein [Colwellia psychrerythraea]|uniref:DUF4136 domain-containing protein n=1 Tax=Colwellia psychrerythraea TaxID=28229 RepID=A0A099KY86_COLPS|nr:DUF4136 domain-containing protein [Colwellia psychrerythraea]KGJ95561.1 protein of unknown function DUF4136 [Colwellia psychrerythraea]
MKILITLLFLFLLAACSSEPSTKFDYNEKTNFSLFKSFQFVEKTSPDLDTNPVMDNRIKQAIESALIRQRFTAQAANADLQIKFHFSQQEKTNNSSFSIGLGGTKIGGSGAASVGVSTSVPIDSDATIITKIFIDISHNGKAIWHGTDIFEGKGDMPFQEKELAITATVNRLLANFPPKKAQE